MGDSAMRRPRSATSSSLSCAVGKPACSSSSRTRCTPWMKSSFAPSFTITDFAFSSSMAALPSADGLRSQDLTASASASVSSTLTLWSALSGRPLVTSMDMWSYRPGPGFLELGRQTWTARATSLSPVQPTESFPLFPLGLVLLPSELVPLHIFEERYKLMIGECLERESEFGIIWLSDAGLKEIGCSARISKVLERFDDGRLNVLVEGDAPFRLLRRIDDLPYPAGDIELLVDEHEGDDAAAAADAVRSRYAD